MDYIPGPSVMTLLDDSYPEGLPPYLVSHVLDQVHWHCRFLREHNLQHTDLELDGSVLLDRDPTRRLPFVSLVYFEGLKDLASATPASPATLERIPHDPRSCG
jgi:hypothetical protein